MLPDAYDSPARLNERLVRLAVTLHVAAQLWSPIPLVRGWLPTVHRAYMPKAAIDEHDHLATRKNDVWPHPGLGQPDNEVFPKAIAPGMQRGTQAHLGLKAPNTISLRAS
jgi:hypothetical protein